MPHSHCFSQEPDHNYCEQRRDSPELRIGKDPTNFEELLLLAREAKNRGSTAGFIVECKAAIAIKNDLLLQKELTEAERVSKLEFEQRRQKFQSDFSQQMIAAKLSSSDAQNVAAIFEGEGKWRDAISLLLQSVKTDQNRFIAWAQLIQSFIEINDFKSADETFQSAQKIFANSKPKRKELLTLLMMSQSESGHLTELQTSMRTYITSFPDSADIKEVTDKYNYYQNDFAEIRKLESLPAAAVMMKIALPLKIFLSPGDFSTEELKIYTSVILAKYIDLSKIALNEWANSSDGRVSFRYVNDANSADIKCKWTTDTSTREHPFFKAQTKFIHNVKLVVSIPQ